jgi:hypothetical protein
LSQNMDVRRRKNGEKEKGPLDIAAGGLPLPG